MPNSEDFYEFPREDVQSAIDSAKEAAAEQIQALEGDVTTLDLTTAQGSEVTLQAACIEVRVKNRKVCLKLPLGFGNACLPIPLKIGDGTTASACLDIRTVFGFPTGVCASVRVQGREVVKKCFP